jgi:hypothetical protein
LIVAEINYFLCRKSGGIEALKMAFTIVRPEYLDDFVDITKPEESDRFRIVMNPTTVDYVILLNRADAVKRIMSYQKPITYFAVEVDDSQSTVFEDHAASLISEFPIMKHFGPIRFMFVNVLQRKEITFERRLLILNYAMATIQGMCSQFKHDLIPGFCDHVIHMQDPLEILKSFDKMPINLNYSLSNGIMVLRNIGDKAGKDFKRVMERAYGGLGISGPETLEAADIHRYIEARKEFARIYQDERPYIFENIMLNYMWTLVSPFTMPNYTIWENFVFYIVLFNALKVLITLTAPKNDDDFAEIVASFDKALAEAVNKHNFFEHLIRVSKDQGFDGNGDLGIITVS